jgi:hypothetical protein
MSVTTKTLCLPNLVYDYLTLKQFLVVAVSSLRCEDKQVEDLE